MKNNTPTLWILITTMDSGIERVKQELLPQLVWADQVIISHQILDVNIIPERSNLWDNVIYTHMREWGLSKSRNKALSVSTTDICHICDDDLSFIPWFIDTVKEGYQNSDFDIISFQVFDEQWNKHFFAKEWKHTRVSVMWIWSWGITFFRKSIIEKWISFDENFGLGTKYPVWEENIFLQDAFKTGLRIWHIDSPITIHPRESSWKTYREELVVARIKVWKRMFWFIGWVLAIFYFLIFDYKNYKSAYTPVSFFVLSCKSLIYGK